MTKTIRKRPGVPQSEGESSAYPSIAWAYAFAGALAVCVFLENFTRALGLFYAGEVGYSMYFVKRGLAEVVKDDKVLHRFRECTLLMPTWFLSRAAFDAAGGFREAPCEDLGLESPESAAPREGASHRERNAPEEAGSSAAPPLRGREDAGAR